MSAGSGKYEIGERIGGGGMADVFHAVVRGAEGFERKVAVKRIKRNISTDKGFAKLFVDEARLAAKLMHPNIVQTIDFDRDSTGCFYLVMELIEGVDLRELVQSGRVPVSAVVFIVCEVLRALDYAHEMVADGRPLTIVHRDISPHNIMLSWQGSVKVVDFGIAKAIEGSLVSRSGSLKGKVAYMSPEQVHGLALDGRSDLFALGIILHELLTGARLFMDKTEAATLSQVLTKPIPSPRALNDLVPEDLDTVVMRLLARDLDQRFERARDALDALSACAVATSRGRTDLETVLGERFPGRGPQRVRHLSSSPSHRSESARLQPSGSRPIGLDSATAETLAATPKAITPAPLLPKKTITAVPVRSASESSSLPLSPTLISPEGPAMVHAYTDSLAGPAKRSPMALIATLGIALVCAVAGLFYFLSGTSGANEESGIELIAVQGGEAGDASVTIEPAMDASVVSARARDAGSIETQSQPESDAAPSAGDARRPDRGKKNETTATGKKAKLTILVKPWASIEIDGKSFGQTPRTIELDRGKHRIVLRNGGLDRVERFSLTLKAGQIRKLDKDWTED